VLAYAALRRGEAPERVAERLSEARRRHSAARIANQETVLAFALLHAYFECVEPRTGNHVSLARLARQFRLAEREVWDLVMDGCLGPARVAENGELMFCPTQEEAVKASPWIGQCAVARTLGVTPETLVSRQALSAATGVLSDDMRHFGVQRHKGATDSSGRLFLHRSLVPASLLQTLEEFTPEVYLARQRSTLMDELRRADFAPEEVDGWHREHVVRRKIRERLEYASCTTLRKAALRDHIDSALFQVPEPGRRAHPLTRFVYIEPALLEHGTIEEIKAWLGGVGPRATRTGDGRRARVETRRAGPRKAR
jgi:hypothetical protein